MAKQPRKTRPAAGRRTGKETRLTEQFASDDERCLFDDYARKRRNIPPPQRVGDVLSRLLTKRGYANVQQKSSLESVWQAAAGEVLAKHTRPGKITRGTWEI